MPRQRSRADHADPDDGPSDADLERFSGVTRVCPACRTELYDDAAICWSCGHALGEKASLAPTWIAIVVGVLLVGLAISLLL